MNAREPRHTALVPAAVTTRLCAALMAVIVPVGIAVSHAACGRDAPTAPSRPIVAASPLLGTWSGPIVDSVDDAGVMEIAITEHVAISLLGSWASRFGDESRSDSGPLTGSVDGATVRLTLQSTKRLCPPVLTPGGTTPLLSATLTVEGDRMTGTYLTVFCGSVRNGRLMLTRRE